jgi:Peptidase M15
MKSLMPKAAFAGLPMGAVARGVGMAALVVLSLALSGCASWQHSGINYPVSITWHDSSWCVPWELKAVLRRVSQRYGAVTVHSTHRWWLENWLKGGKARSFHLTCRAVDFSVRGDPPGVLNYLKSQKAVGGYARYPQRFYHIDNGARRTW